jgi:AAA+ superfamily predicted ATPase
MYYQVTTAYSENKFPLEAIKQSNSVLSSKYNMMYQRNIDISLFKLHKDKLTILAKTNSSFDQVHNINEVVNKYLEECLQTKAEFNCEPMTNGSFIKLLDHKRKQVDSDTIEVLASNEFITTVNYKHTNTLLEYSESIVRHKPSMDSKIYLSSYNTETSLIHKVTTDRFIGHPVHYRIVGSRSKDIRSVVDSLVYELHMANRILHPLVVYSRFSESNMFDEIYELDTLVPLCDGGILVLEINDLSFNHLSVAQLKETMATIAHTITMNRHKILFILRSDHMDSNAFTLLCNELSSLMFVDLIEESLSLSDSKRYLQDLVRNHLADPIIVDSLLDQCKSFYSLNELNNIFNDWHDKYVLSTVFSQYKKQSIVTVSTHKKVKENISAYDKLNNMIGLDEAKSLVNQIIDSFKADKIYKEIGVEIKSNGKHMCFVGNPGTAKTTVARYMGQIFKDHQILTVGDVIEVDRSQLVERYVGWTAKNIKDLFAKAKGSILFIDEAYSLLDFSNGSFGDEAINTIVQEMDNCRDDTIVIFAGYPTEMDHFINRNPGLKSRINYNLHFKNYTVDQLVNIAKLMITDIGFMVTEESLDYIRYNFLNNERDNNFGNGRYVRNIVEKAITNHSSQLAKQNCSILSKDEILTLQVNDFESIFKLNDTNVYMQYMLS